MCSPESHVKCQNWWFLEHKIEWPVYDKGSCLSNAKTHGKAEDSMKMTVMKHSIKITLIRLPQPKTQAMYSNRHARKHRSWNTVILFLLYLFCYVTCTLIKITCMLILTCKFSCYKVYVCIDHMTLFSISGVKKCVIAAGKNKNPG